MGATIMFMALTEPKICLKKKIHTFVALAPAVFIYWQEYSKTMWDMAFLIESAG